jgi:hypothetical protein
MYVLNENMEGGYPTVFQLAIDKVKLQSKYYLLFGRQSDSKGINTKFYVALNLPNQSIFYCIDLLSPTLRTDLIAKYGIIANTIYKARGNSMYLYHEAEIGTIDSLRSYVTALKECCLGPGENKRLGPSCTSCAFSEAEFGQDLISKGFSNTENQIKLSEILSIDVSPYVIGRTNLILEIEGESIEIDKQISGIAERFVQYNPSKSIKIYLNRYDNLCGNFDAIYNQFLDNGSDAKVFVVAIQSVNNNVKLYFDYEGELGIDGTDAISFVKGFPDHYFDLDGNYLGKDEGNWSRIRVINKPLSQISGLYKNQTKQIINKTVGEVNSVDLSNHIDFVYGQGGDPGVMFSKIGGYYAYQIEILQPVVLKQVKIGDKPAIAWVEHANLPTDYSHIYFSKSPFYKFNDNYNQFINTLYHEHLHIITKKGVIQCDHAKLIYLEQMKHASFSKCSDDFKKGMFGNFGCLLAKCYTIVPEYGGGSGNVNLLINQANKIMKKYGWNLSLYQDQTGFYRRIQNIKSQIYYETNCDESEGM